VCILLCPPVQLSRTFLEMPVVVHEFVVGPVPEEDLQPVLYNYRAKLWRALMPPDQYNPAGYIDGDLTHFMPTQVGRRSRGWLGRVMGVGRVAGQEGAGGWWGGGGGVVLVCAWAGGCGRVLQVG
jgi:hypothetical protein